MRPNKLITSPAWVAALLLYLASIVDSVMTQTMSPGYIAIMAGVTYYLFEPDRRGQ